MMSRETKKLKVEGLPLDVTKDKVKVVFQNAKRKGGGPIENVELVKSDSTCTAVITFETSDAVDLILSKGNMIDVLKTNVTVEPVFDDVKNEKARSRERQMKDSGSDVSFSGSETEPLGNVEKHLKGRKPKTSAEKVNARNSESSSTRKKSTLKYSGSGANFSGSETELQDNEEKHLTGAKPKKSNEKFKAQTSESSSREKSVKSLRKMTSTKHKEDSSDDKMSAKELQSKPQKSVTKSMRKSSQVAPEESESESEMSDHSTEEEIMPWETTIKAELRDRTLVSKDRYILYFEDPKISQGSFKSESLLLDGVNKLLFVTFDTKEAAVATCKFKHVEEDSNFQSVRMATPEDFDTYNNLLCVQGYPCDIEDKRTELIQHVQDVTGMHVEEILLGEDPMKAIIAFDPEQCEDISEATWQCADNEINLHLITAPVKRTYSVQVQGLKPTSTENVLKRYMSSKISGGGPVKSVKKLSETVAIVYFEDEKGFDGVLEKDEHKLEGATLHMEPYYPCLSTETHQYEGIPVPSGGKKRFSGPVQNSRPKTRPPGPPKQKSLFFSRTNLCLSRDVSYHNKIFYGVVRLDEYGFHLLQRYKTELNTQAEEFNCICKFDNRDNQFLLCVELNYPKKLIATEVKERLQNATEHIYQYLQQFQCQKARVDATHIHRFQDFCYSRLERASYDEGFQFNHRSNEIVVLYKKDATRILKELKELYQRFLSEDVKSVRNSTAQKGKMTPSVSRDYEQKLPSQMPADNDDFRNNRVQRFSSDGASAIKEDGVLRSTNMKQFDGNLYVEEITETFNIEELTLFQKTGKCGDLGKADTSLQLTIDFDNLQVIIKGKDKRSVSQAQVELLKFSRDIQKKNVTQSYTSNQLKLLSRKHVCDKINKLFDDQRIPAYFHCTDRNAVVNVTRDAEDNKWERIIQSQAVEHKKDIVKDTILLFETEKGHTFLTDLSTKDDTEVQLQGNQIIVVTSASQEDSIAQEINSFIEQNQLHVKKIPFSSGKWIFAQQFLKDELTEIKQSCMKEQSELREMGENLQLKGLIEHVTQGEAKLLKLRWVDIPNVCDIDSVEST